MTSNPRPIGILGGTFDPIHYGHLRPALEVLEALDLAGVRFIPCRLPSHRGQPLATPEQRLTLLQLAVADQPGFLMDDRELHRDGPSYMVDTLTSLRTEVGATPLCLLLGMDAFAGLTTWRHWQKILELAHLVVTNRPDAGPPLSTTLNALVEQRKIRQPEALRQCPAGGILFQSVTQLAISATRIRQLLAQGHSPRHLLPEAVWKHVREQGLYRPPLASTCEDSYRNYAT